MWINYRLLIRKVLQRKLTPHPPEPREFLRASGLCLCPNCGWEYSLHPPDVEEPDLRVLCDGLRVKL